MSRSAPIFQSSPFGCFSGVRGWQCVVAMLTRILVEEKDVKFDSVFCQIGVLFMHVQRIQRWCHQITCPVKILQRLRYYYVASKSGDVGIRLSEKLIRVMLLDNRVGSSCGTFFTGNCIRHLKVGRLVTYASLPFTATLLYLSSSLQILIQMVSGLNLDF